MNRMFRSAICLATIALVLTSCGSRHSAEELQKQVVGTWDGLGRMSRTGAELAFNEGGTLQYHRSGLRNSGEDFSAVTANFPNESAASPPLRYEILDAHRMLVYHQGQKQEIKPFWEQGKTEKPKSSHGCLRAFPVPDTVYNIYLEGDHLSLVDPWSDESRRFRRHHSSGHEHEESGDVERAIRSYKMNTRIMIRRPRNESRY